MDFKLGCKFDVVSCKKCPKYNCCLLQMTYANTLSLANMIIDLEEKIDNLNLIKSEVSSDESDIRYNCLQSSITSMDSKIDDLIKSYNSYEYIPIVNKE